MHSTIGMSPNDALKPDNALWVSWHLWNSAKRDRQHLGIKEGDMVRVNIKKGTFSKSHMSNWPSEK